MDDSLSHGLFLRVSRFIEGNYGIKLPLEKKVMIQSRLSKRVRELNYPSINEYVERILESPVEDAEVHRVLDLISTHMTSFFRESRHFDILVEQVLPGLCETRTFSRPKPLIVWSAACSTGEEPYSLAMVLDEFRRKNRQRYRGFEYAVLATDLSQRVLEVARKAVYPVSAADSIPVRFQKDYLMRHRSKAVDQIKIVPEIRQRVFFHPLNLLAAQYEIRNAIHVVFCRNVLIYFNREHQEAVLRRLNDTLQPGGYLFVGHAESMSGVLADLVSFAPTIYRKEADHGPQDPSSHR